MFGAVRGWVYVPIVAAFAYGNAFLFTLDILTEDCGAEVSCAGGWVQDAVYMQVDIFLLFASCYCFLLLLRLNWRVGWVSSRFNFSSNASA